MKYANAKYPELDNAEARDRLREAVWKDHPCTDTESCDIACALDNGFVFSAAHHLLGSTETPALDKLLKEFAKEGIRIVGDDHWPLDWPEWVAFFKGNSIKCEACGACSFIEVPGWPPEKCGNCLKPFPKAQEEDAEE